MKCSGLRLRWAISALVLAGVGCGGGGGGDDVAFLGGIYEGLVTKTVDTCGSRADPIFVTSLTVNQDGRRIVVNQGRLTYEGRTTSDASFIGTYSDTEGNCRREALNTVSNIDSKKGDYALTLTVRCGPVVCSVSYIGTLDRSRSSARSLTEADPVAEQLGRLAEAAREK